ncbi:MAG TPA: sialidase family protein [Thermoanaerobaculia bacterium]|nr:sialidase family protein [Thermoanaerobaculia bacterium]
MSKSTFIAAGAIVLVASFVATADPAHAAVTGSGTLSPTNPTVTYNSGPFLIPNPTIQVVSLAGIGDQPICQDPVLPCDDFLLDVDIPAGYKTQHPADRVQIKIEWQQTGNDFDMFVLDEAGAVVDTSATGGRPEIVILPVQEGHRRYTVRVEPFLVTNETFAGTITLGPPPFTPFIAGSEPPPQFQSYPAPNDWGSNYGEPSIGFDPKSGTLLFTGRRYLNVGGKTLKVSFDDSTNPPTPTWIDVTSPNSLGTSLDPIGYTDRTTGRTFVSQLHGACSLTELTDDAGSTWIPSQGCGIGTMVDHQTLGGGPFAPPLTGGIPNVYPNAVYYCAQASVEASCAVSLDGGLTFGPGVPVYTTECGGLHGHIKVAPDGTVYLPNKGCAPNQAVVVSEDNGQHWQIRGVPDSLPGDTDPSVGIATDGTVYFGYVNGDGHPRIAVSHDKGHHWEHDTDVGTPFGLQNAVFPAVVAGDPKRASFAFHGTTQDGNYESIDFAGVWHLYVATTYDGGATWNVVKAAANPVQGPGGICSSGIACNSEPDNRNLLDFFDATMDAKGKTVIGFTDGCIGPCGADGTPNAFDSYGTIARQSAGLTLLSQFDPPPPTEDVTDSTRFVQSGLTWKTGLSTFKLKIKNVAANALAAPLHVLVAEIQSTSGNVTVANADNGQPGAGATFSYSALLNGDSVLSPNEMSGSRDLSFNNAGKEKFSVTLRVIRGNPASQSMPARDGANSSEVRYLRLSVDPLLGVVNVQLITR